MRFKRSFLLYLYKYIMLIFYILKLLIFNKLSFCVFKLETYSKRFCVFLKFQRPCQIFYVFKEIFFSTFFLRVLV